MRRAIDLGYPLRHAVSGRPRWPVGTVATLGFDDGHAMPSIRNYDGESAVIRDAGAQTGCAIDGRELDRVCRPAVKAARDAIHSFRDRTPGAPILDGIEVTEAQFTALGTAAPTTSPMNRRRIEGTRTVTTTG